MSMCYECDACGLVIECDGCYAPAREGEPVGPLDCTRDGCDGLMDYIGEGWIEGDVFHEE